VVRFNALEILLQHNELDLAIVGYARVMDPEWAAMIRGARYGGLQPFDRAAPDVLT
jgi:hypothetical protein